MKFFRRDQKRVPQFASPVISSLLSITASIVLFRVFLNSGMVVWGYGLVVLIPTLALVQLIRIHRVYKVAYPRALAGDAPARKSLIEMVNNYYLMNAVVLAAVAVIVVSRSH